MSGTGSAPEWVITGGSIPAAGWYRDPAGVAVLRWWDGRVWTAGTLGPSGPAAAVPGRLSIWLAAFLSSPAAVPLLLALAVVSGLGWAVAAAILASTVATGHAVAPAIAPLNLSVVVVLPVLDLVTALCGRAFRSGRRRAPSAADRRAIRAAARLDRAANGDARRAISVWFRVRRQVVRSRFSSLPRPIGRMYGPASAATFLLFFWLGSWCAAHGEFPLGDAAGSTALGQQVNVVAWMAHLITWCGLACRQLDHRRAAARMWTPVPAKAGL